MTTSGLSTAAAGLHRWGLPRGLIVLFGGAAMVIIVAGIQGAAWLIGAAFMALIVVITVAPARRRKGWPAWSTTLVAALFVYATLIGFALGIILSIAQVLRGGFWRSSPTTSPTWDSSSAWCRPPSSPCWQAARSRW